VRIRDVQGEPATETYKLLLSAHAGWAGEARVAFSWLANGFVQLSIRWKIGQRRNMPPGASSALSTAWSRPSRPRQ